MKLIRGSSDRARQWKAHLIQYLRCVSKNDRSFLYMDMAVKSFQTLWNHNEAPTTMELQKWIKLKDFTGLEHVPLGFYEMLDNLLANVLPRHETLVSTLFRNMLSTEKYTLTQAKKDFDADDDEVEDRLSSCAAHTVYVFEGNFHFLHPFMEQFLIDNGSVDRFEKRASWYHRYQRKQGHIVEKE